MKQSPAPGRCNAQVFMDASGKQDRTKAVVTNRSDRDKW